MSECWTGIYIDKWSRRLMCLIDGQVSIFASIAME